jgi:hypothetical protein
VIGLASMAWIYESNLPHNHPIRTDGEGYYMFLPAVFVDHDLTLHRTLERRYGGSRGVPGVRRLASGRIVQKYPLGEAVMLTPFFAGGAVAAAALGAEQDGYSRPYQTAAVLGALLYVLLGLAILGHLLLRWFSPGTVVVGLLAATFGTGLFHHAAYDSILSHAFSFFLVVLVLRLSIALWEGQHAVTAVALGAAGGLLTIVRPTNIVALLIPALVGVRRVRDIPERARVIARRPKLVALGTASFFVALVPQLVYWHVATGQLFPYTYGNEHVDLLHPHLLQVLFSVRKGLFFWSPLLLLAVAGLPLLRRFAPELLLPAIVFLVVDAWVISSWETWWYGSSFGMRPFVEAVPVFTLGLCAALDGIRGRVLRPLLAVAVLAATFLSVHAMLAYWRGALPVDGTDWSAYVHSFGDLW